MKAITVRILGVTAITISSILIYFGIKKIKVLTQKNERNDRLLVQLTVAFVGLGMVRYFDGISNGIPVENESSIFSKFSYTAHLLSLLVMAGCMFKLLMVWSKCYDVVSAQMFGKRIRLMSVISRGTSVALGVMAFFTVWVNGYLLKNIGSDQTIRKMLDNLGAYAYLLFFSAVAMELMALVVLALGLLIRSRINAVSLPLDRHFHERTKSSTRRLISGMWIITSFTTLRVCTTCFLFIKGPNDESICPHSVWIIISQWLVIYPMAIGFIYLAREKKDASMNTPLISANSGSSSYCAPDFQSSNFE
eukprot:TRINITY_DN44922_c0_g2_i1.p1 TRINITY_DN44922_c0_g2~~TRINITY_DN44922_c0_g2_i1.p1  ORF type:complete len:306 (+),score=51.19 TRINITY_DN44922_c0_g2_i1:104-1021(+)